MITKFKLFEVCDAITLPNGLEINYEHYSTIPFFFYKKEFIVGDFGESHGSMVQKLVDSDIENDDMPWGIHQEMIWNHIYHQGRLFTKQRIFSFWDVPDKTIFSEIVYELEEKLGDKIWNNGFKLELVKTENIESNHFDSYDVKSYHIKGADTKFIPIELYKKSYKTNPKSLAYRQSIYQESLTEKYMDSNYPPLYHYTSNKLEKILKSDSLIKKDPYKGKECVCFTRDPLYSYDGGIYPRLKLDQNKLRIDGYIPKPIDEFGDEKLGNIKDSTDRKHIKSPFHGTTEWEFEERIYKTIKNLGKYIISIQIPKSSEKSIRISGIVNDNVWQTQWYSPEGYIKLPFIETYLKKYPHIKFEYYNIEKRWKTTPITEGKVNDQLQNFYIKQMKTELIKTGERQPLKKTGGEKWKEIYGFIKEKFPDYEQLLFYYFLSDKILTNKIKKILDNYSKILFKSNIYMVYVLDVMLGVGNNPDDETGRCRIYFRNLFTQRVKPQKYIYHRSGAVNRESILKNGLILKSWDKSPEWNDAGYLSYPPAIFATNTGRDDVWRSYGDLWRIDTTNLPNKWWYDLNFFGGGVGDKRKKHIMTFEPIPPEYLTLVDTQTEKEYLSDRLKKKDAENKKEAEVILDM